MQEVQEECTNISLYEIYAEFALWTGSCEEEYLSYMKVWGGIFGSEEAQGAAAK